MKTLQEYFPTRKKFSIGYRKLFLILIGFPHELLYINPLILKKISAENKKPDNVRRWICNKVFTDHLRRQSLCSPVKNKNYKNPIRKYKNLNIILHSDNLFRIRYIFRAFHEKVTQGEESPPFFRTELSCSPFYQN